MIFIWLVLATPRTEKFSGRIAACRAAVRARVPHFQGREIMARSQFARNRSVSDADATRYVGATEFSRRRLLQIGGIGLVSVMGRHGSHQGIDSGPQGHSGHGGGIVPRVFSWAGDATQTTVEVSAHTAPAVSLALAVSASPDMSAATVHPMRRPISDKGMV
jgi:hypothetical protein